MSSVTSEISASSSSSFSSSTRSLTEFSELDSVRLGLDLVAASRRTLSFLRSVSLSDCHSLIDSVRRYTDLWLPLLSDLSVEPTPPLVIPPLDIEWVWFCHTLNPVRYRDYCESKFSKVLGKALIFDEENEEYALMRCREIWVKKYPNEAFDNENETEPGSGTVDPDVLEEVTRQKDLYGKFSEPYRSEVVYLIAARQRYKGFVSMMQRKSGVLVGSRLVPASDILLMLLTHQSYPTVYFEDMKEKGKMMKLASVWETVGRKEVEETANLWETMFDQPYEKAGGEINLNVDRVIPMKSPIYWEVSDVDVNTKYKSMLPRFLLEVCVFIKLKAELRAAQEDCKNDVLRLRMARCHRELKLDKTISKFSNKSWRKAWHLYCEFGTKGVVIELQRLGGYCFKAKTVEESVHFNWNDLLRATSLTLQRQIDQQVKLVASITPPVQAPYLLKCVPDRVTDDSGAMISDVILKMNQYHPQEGRWLSRSVLDHAGRECFVIRMRVGGGFWRRGGETPSTVQWEDRIIEIREGAWSYVAGSIGRAPEKVVGTATPKEPSEQWKAAWKFSTGDELMIQWESSTSISGLRFSLTNHASESTVKLLRGRKMQYHANKGELQNAEVDSVEDDDEGFLTLVRFTDDDPNGRATALLDWKLLVVEFMPEEDAVFLLLLCISVLRSVSDMKKDDMGSLLVRRRLKEVTHGRRDWGSVILHPYSCSSSTSSPYVRPWYLNAKAVTGSDFADRSARTPRFSYSPEEGNGQLYKRGIFT